MRGMNVFWKFCGAALMGVSFSVAAIPTPGFAQQGYNQDPGAGQSSKKLNIDPSRDPYTYGMQAKEKGDYQKAGTFLGMLAVQGRGFEMAQMELGNTYILKSRQTTDPDEADRTLATGIGWILRAAQNGLGEADTRLVKLYLDGDGILPDRVEAAKWYLLWRRSPTRMQIGSSQFDPTLEQRLKSSLQPTDWVEAQKRADSLNGY